MNRTLFKKINKYKSDLSPSEIEARLKSLLKREDKYEDPPFTGKVSATSFNLTPILGLRQGFRITMLGEVSPQSPAAITITYTIATWLRVLVRDIVIFYFLVGVVCCVFNFKIAILEENNFKHADFYPFIASIIGLVFCKFTFNAQYNEYSSLIASLLELENVD